MLRFVHRQDFKSKWQEPLYPAVHTCVRLLQDMIKWTLLPLRFKNIFLRLLCVCVCVVMYVCKSEDNKQKSVLFPFYQGGSRDKAQAIKIAGKHLSSLKHLTWPQDFLKDMLRHSNPWLNIYSKE